MTNEKGYEVGKNSKQYAMILNATLAYGNCKEHKTIIDTKYTVKEQSEIVAIANGQNDYNHKVSRTDFEVCMALEKQNDFILFSSFKAALRFGYVNLANGYRDIKRCMGIFYHAKSGYSINWQRYNVVEDNKKKEKYHYYLMDENNREIAQLDDTMKQAKKQALAIINGLRK